MKTLVAFSIIGLLFVVQNATAQNRASNYDFLARAEAREVKRWSLQDWLAQKERNKMMDLWLAFNTPSPYEAMVGLSQKSYTFTPTLNDVEGSQNDYQNLVGEVHLYASIVGLSAGLENNSNEDFNTSYGMFNLRLFGDSLQNSHLTLHYGLRSKEQTIANEDIRSSHPFAQVSLQLYLSHYFGIDSKYRSSSSPNTTGNFKDNFFTEKEVGLFIDFKALRIFGNWYQEDETYTWEPTGDKYKDSRTGIRSGIKIFY